MARIFISYRRGDSATITDRINEYLTERFGKESVFRDIDTIPAGKDFRHAIESAIASCEIMLVIVGPSWSTITDEQGDKRLDNPADFVRLEVETGLRLAEVNVIPVLVGNASMPKQTELPASLGELRYRNAVSVRNDPDFSGDIQRLTEQIRQSANWEAKGPRTKRKIGPVIVVLGLLILTVLAALLLTQNMNVDSSQTTLTDQNTTTLQQPGLYLTRVLNPPAFLNAGDSVVTSVWVQAVGEATYTIDGIANLGRAMCLTTGGGGRFSGAVQPDAIYSFPVGELDQEPIPLNPALRLTPLDPREISFTLGLAYSASTSCNANSLIQLHYHDNTGRVGTLMLVDASPAAIFLSKLLDENVRATDIEPIFIGAGVPYTVTPGGLQIGTDDSVSAVAYMPLVFPHVSLDELTANPTRSISIGNMDERAPINTLITDRGLVERLATETANGETAAFDLCAGLVVDECEQALVKATQNDAQFEPALKALIIRHAIHPNEALPTAIMQNLPALKALSEAADSYRTDELVYNLSVVLAMQKTGNWVDPLIEFAKLQQARFSGTACDVLSEVVDELTEAQSAQVEELCTA